MTIVVRPATQTDAEACGRICYFAFKSVNERHGFPSNFPTPEAALKRVQACLNHPMIYGVVAATTQGSVSGFAFLSERDPIRAIGPVAVDPSVQASGVGRTMLEALLERARGSRGVRLLQDGFNMHSFALYARLGFEAQELFVLLEGSPDKPAAGEWEVRSMTPADVPACENLHDQVHGFTRTNELRDLLSAGSPVVAVREGAIRAYLTEPAVWFVNHAVAHSDEDMEALLLGTRAFSSGPLSFLMPVRRAALLRLCLAQRFQTVRPMMLMTMGEYREPNGTYFPSVLY